MEHLEKDIKKMWHHKDVIILVLVIALVVVSGIAICLGINSEEHDGRGDYGRMERGGGDRQGNYVDDNNQNPNDGEYADDASSTNATSSMVKKAINEVKETFTK